MHMAIAASSPSESDPTSPTYRPQSRRPGSTSGTQNSFDLPPGAPFSKSDPRVFKVNQQGIADLTGMAPCHDFAQQALKILRYLSKKWNVDVGMRCSKDKEAAGDMDCLIGLYTSSLNFFALNVQMDDVICAWGTGGGTVIPRTEGANETEGKPKENPLFWPFPCHERPTLPSGKELEKAGFAFT